MVTVLFGKFNGDQLTAVRMAVLQHSGSLPLAFTRAGLDVLYMTDSYIKDALTLSWASYQAAQHHLYAMGEYGLGLAQRAAASLASRFEADAIVIGKRDLAFEDANHIFPGLPSGEATSTARLRCHILLDELAGTLSANQLPVYIVDGLGVTVTSVHELTGVHRPSHPSAA